MPANPDTPNISINFSSSLRSQPAWRALRPVILAFSSQFQATEKESLEDHDLSFHSSSSAQTLRVLFLSPSSLEPSRRQETVSRLERFSPHALASPKFNAIVFLASESSCPRQNARCKIDGVLGLQVLIAESLKSSIPIIPVPNAACLLSSMQEYMDSLVDLPVQKPALSEAVALLARTVRSKYFKMTDQDVQLLSEMSPSLVIMSRAARTENGAQLVRNYFDGELGKEMIRFWEEDER